MGTINVFGSLIQNPWKKNINTFNLVAIHDNNETDELI